MRSRWLSTFALIGYLLIAIGVAGLVIGPKFVFDPGQLPSSPGKWFLQPCYYVIVGILMIANGMFGPANTTDTTGLESGDARKSDGNGKGTVATGDTRRN